MKAGFQNKLDVELRDDSDNIWIIKTPLVFWSEEFGLIEAPVDFETDFASVPRVPIAYRIWGDRAHREAVLHDYVFRIDSKPNLSFMDCNKLFLEAMKSRGVSWFIRYPMFLGVCACGIFSYHKKKVMDKL